MAGGDFLGDRFCLKHAAGSLVHAFHGISFTATFDGDDNGGFHGRPHCEHPRFTQRAQNWIQLQ
jgi:hypothetical protein